jgi:hypothetical protein
MERFAIIETWSLSGRRYWRLWGSQVEQFEAVLMFRTILFLIAATAALGTACQSSLAGEKFDHSLDTPMEFRLATTGGNCGSCEWIAAEGEIRRDTSEKFEAFLKAHNIEPGGTGFLHIHSPGGSLFAGIKLGEVIRRYGLNVFVAKTTGEIRESGYIDVHESQTVPGMCASACVYSFLGGVTRFAVSDHYTNAISVDLPGKLAVHQFYSADALVDFDKKIFSGADMAADQVLNGVLLEYIVRMGAMPGLLTLASQTPPPGIHELTDDELRDTGVENAESKASAEISVFAKDAASVVVKYSTSREDITSVLFCSAQRKLMMLTKILARYGTTPESIAEWSLYENVVLKSGGGEVPVSKKEIKVQPAGSTTAIRLLFQVGDAPIETFANATDFTFTGGTSRYGTEAAQSLSFQLPAAFKGMALLPRTCIRK